MPIFLAPAPPRSRARTGTRAALFAALCIFLPAPVTAQSPTATTTPWRTVRQDHLWVATFIDQPITARWAFLGDVQWRRTEAGRNPQQLLTRGSLTYRVTPGFRLGAGVNVIATAPYGELPSARPLRDRQIFYIAQINQKLGGTDVMHRYRFENRWLADVLEDAAGKDSLSDSRFAQRARYMLRGSRALGGLTLRKQPCQRGLETSARLAHRFRCPWRSSGPRSLQRLKHGSFFQRPPPSRHRTCRSRSRSRRA